MQVGAELRGQPHELREGVSEGGGHGGGGGGGVEVDGIHEVVEGGDKGLKGEVLAVKA